MSKIRGVNDMTRPLEKYKDYTREEVHAIFSPNTRVHAIFSPNTRVTPQSGSWGLQGIIQIPGRDGDFVFFVTEGNLC